MRRKVKNKKAKIYVGWKWLVEEKRESVQRSGGGERKISERKSVSITHRENN